MIFLYQYEFIVFLKNGCRTWVNRKPEPGQKWPGSFYSGRLEITMGLEFHFSKPIIFMAGATGLEPATSGVIGRVLMITIIYPYLS